MFIAALFTRAKRWKLPQCPLLNEWLNKLWYINTKEHYSAPQSKEILTHASTRLNREAVMLSEINQSQKGMYCKYEVPRFIETERRKVVASCWGQRRGKWRSPTITKMGPLSFVTLT